MKTTIIDKVILIYFKNSLEGIVKDSSSAIRFMDEWIRERNLIISETRDSFHFIDRDVLKLRLK